MFGLPSLTKLLVLAGIVAAVWYGFRYFSRLQEKRELADKAERRQRGRKVGGRKKGGEAEDVEEMVQCAVCEAFVPAKGAGNCGRSDCPY